MTKRLFSRRSRLRLSALVLGGLICGSTASAADLVAATASNYSQSDIGTVTGSRVTTDVDATPRKAILKDQGGDAAFYNFHQDGLSRLLMRKSSSGLPSLMYDAGALGMAGAQIAEGTITASPNTHSVAATSTTIYATGYNLGKIGVVKRSGANLVEDTAATIDLKSDIKNHAHYDFNGTYEIHENNGTVTQKTGSEAAAKVHGEALLIDGRNLYVAASVNPNGGYQPYDDSFLIQYRIKDDAVSSTAAIHASCATLIRADSTASMSTSSSPASAAISTVTVPGIRITLPSASQRLTTMAAWSARRVKASSCRLMWRRQVRICAISRCCRTVRHTS